MTHPYRPYPHPRSHSTAGATSARSIFGALITYLTSSALSILAPLSILTSLSILAPLSISSLEHLSTLSSAAWAQAGVQIQEGAQRVEGGVWVPILGEVGRRPISRVEIGGDGALYAVGAGRVWRSPDIGADAHTERWNTRGRYAPSLSWDEAEGISAEGPFNGALLVEVERQIGVVLESMLEGQGDDEWITEDAANALIESFEDEPLPALDSPYRVNHVIPQADGVWLATGAGIWATTRGTVIPIEKSPRPALGLIQIGAELWTSTSRSVYSTVDYLSDLKNLSETRWRLVNELKQTRLLRYRGAAYATRDDQLWRLKLDAPPQAITTPIGVKTIISAHSARGALSSQASALAQPSAAQIPDQLWALTQRGLWHSVQSSPSAPIAWKRCLNLEAPLAHLKATHAEVFVVTPRIITRISRDCKSTRRYRAPASESVMITDVSLWEGKLYIATSGGLFSWEGLKSTEHSQVALRYLKRDLALFPRLFKVYQAALREQGLEHKSNYGARPVLSALLPQLRMRYITRPSRDDQLPTFNDGNRQLTLLQPAPQFEVFLEWRVSLDFLTMLIDPERASSIAETQSALEGISGDPLNINELESETGLMEDWGEDTLTSQAQRLAMTTLALERRQKHRDRQSLRVTVTRLHRERIQLTYRRWLHSGDAESATSRRVALRIQEIDALLDAATGYQLTIQRTMRSPI